MILFSRSFYLKQGHTRDMDNLADSGGLILYRGPVVCPPVMEGHFRLATFFKGTTALPFILTHGCHASCCLGKFSFIVLINVVRWESYKNTATHNFGKAKQGTRVPPQGNKKKSHGFVPLVCEKVKWLPIWVLLLPSLGLTPAVGHFKLLRTSSYPY